MSKRATKLEMYERMKTLVESKGGILISKEYTLSGDKYEIEDDKGRRFFKTWDSLKCGEWSHFSRSEALTKLVRKHTIEDLHKYAETLGGKCLSTVYTHDKTKYEWEDDEGFRWFACWKTVSKGVWSPNKKRQKLSQLKTKYTIADLKQFAISKGGECLSEVYPANSICLWKDRNGVTFKKSWFNTMKLDDVLYIDKSRGQSQICDWIKNEMGHKIKINDREILKPKEIDVFIPDCNIAVEYHGLYWHTVKKINKNLHINKYNDCKQQNIKLIQIFEHEWKDRTEQVKSFLQSALGKNSRLIYARKCELVELSSKEANMFLDTYHIQGKCNIKKAYGLKLNNELLMLVSIGVHHRNSKEFVLNRCVSKTNVTVVGGLSRLCKAALKDFTELSTWVDKRWSNGESWMKLGWKVTQDLVPDYFYYNEKEKSVVSKQSRKKSLVGTPEGMTEKEHAENEGLYQVYDAGKIKLTLK